MRLQVVGFKYSRMFLLGTEEVMFSHRNLYIMGFVILKLREILMTSVLMLFMRISKSCLILHAVIRL